MAAGKKQLELTAEEKLQQALVPEAEQPYKVPDNWCWTYIKCVSEVVTGGTPSKKHIEYYGGNFPFFKPSDLDAERYVYDASEYLSEEGKKVSRIIPKYSTAVCCIGSIGKSGYLEIEGTTNQQINSAIPKFNSLYLYYFIKSEYFIDQLWKKASATTISIVNKSKMEDCVFPLPPLVEQQRIVERIETLFAKLDEAKEKLQNTIDTIEARKAAILHKAFTGELTANWRNQHGLTLDSWEEKTVTDLCSIIVDCPHSTPKWEKEGMICLRTTNIKAGYLDLSELKYVTESTFVERNKRCIPQYGDVVLTREGSIGDIAVIPEGLDICLGQRMMLLRPKECESNFLVYFFINPMIIDKIREKTMGSTAPRMNMSDIKKLMLKCPTLDEQTEIVRIVDNLLAKEQQAQQLAQNALAQIDLIKKSILARAFRGQLATNNPADEPAVELLKRVL